MKPLYNISLFCLLLLIFSACEDDGPYCTIKDENFAVATFLGKTYEPYWNTGSFHSGCRYSLEADNRNSGDIWNLSFFTEVDADDYWSFWLRIWIGGIEDPGSYPIEGEYVPFPDTKTFLWLSAYDSNGNYYPNFFSVAETGFIEVTEYDAQAGILIGTFSCDMSNGNEIIPISGEFNINLPELEECNKPCWL